MLDIITLAAAKAISGGGGGGGGVTPQQLEEALAAKQNLLTAGTGIGITDDEIRVTYGEESSYSNTPIFAGTMETTGELVDDLCFGAIMNGTIISENDTLKIIVGSEPNENVYTDIYFVDMTTGDTYQQALIGIGEQMGAEYRYAAFVNCHGIKVSATPGESFLVTDADGNKQTERAFIVTFGTASGIPIVSIIANYMPSENYAFYKKNYVLLPNTALDFGAVAVGDERPVNGDAVKAAINGAGNGITLTMDAAKNLTVALRDALGQTIDDDTVNLPLESMVIGGRYADGVLYLTIIDQAEELEIPIADIVSGLVPDTRTVAGIPLSSNISAAALAAIIGGELTHVNADWNDTNPASAAYIANKPNVPNTANWSTVTDHIGNTWIHVTSSEKSTWNGKYSKPSGGIPAGDIASGVIPTDVSDLNNDLNFATESFVNSSIATNTAFFRGTFESVSNLPSTNVSNNDYAFVISTTSGGNPEYDRYKYVVSSGSGAWQKEYTLNNSSFTAAQWAAIQSGITAQLVSKISGIPQNIVTGANGGSAIHIVVSSTAPASGTASNVLTLVTG